jgi:signal transduction histidine kinase
LRLLSDAGAVLTELGNETAMLQRLARLSVPLFADWCVVCLVDNQRNIRTVGHAHADPQKQRVLDKLLEIHPLYWNTTSITVNVLRTGQPELVAEFPGSLLDSIATDSEHRDLIAALAPRSVVSAPIVVRGQTIGAITFSSSESARQYTLDHVSVVVELAHRAAASLENTRLYQELQEAQRQKDDSLAMLAHELRNPLAAIQYANRIPQLTGELNPDALETIDRQVKNLSHLIDDLLDVSRITRDKIHLKKEPIDAAVLVRRAVASVQPLVAARKHELQVAVVAEPLSLVVDATRIEQVLVNLLSNASKYTPDGGHIALRCYGDHGEVVIEVKDNGIGIPSEALPQVFELFTQVDKSLDRSQGGLGIGLTVARRLTEMHGGTITVDSPGLGHGSVFTVRLPLEEAIADNRAGAPHIGSGRARRILVVEDNVDTASSVATLLKLAGHKVSMAHDGHAALEAARAERPEVVLLDIGLPGIDGYMVARRLRDDPELGKLRLVAVSGYGQPDDRRRTAEAGFDVHLVKPVDFDSLLSAIE